jgi:uncharacterized coiled-coil DUF342 family protein
MCRHLLFAFLSLGLVLPPAWAQAPAPAPTEERRTQGSPLSDAQQRAEFARQGSAAASSRVMKAELALNEADTEMKDAQKQYDAVRGRQDKAKKELAEARAASDAARKSFEQASTELERTRRGQK